MILEIDCGNTLIKWRVFDASSQLVSISGAAHDLDALMRELCERTPESIASVRIVSVRSDAETDALVRALQNKFSVTVSLACSSTYLSGVTNGYAQPHLLGTDRWLALVSAYDLMRSACLVLDLGTAVTSDFVTAKGLHLGGYICPGVRLMREQLGRHAGRINIHQGARTDCRIPGITTAEAVEGGTQLMLSGFVDTQINIAREVLGETFSVVITGGDASLIAASLTSAVIVPDLVFRGLRLAIPD